MSTWVTALQFGGAAADILLLPHMYKHGGIREALSTVSSNDRKVLNLKLLRKKHTTNLKDLKGCVESFQNHMAHGKDVWIAVSVGTGSLFSKKGCRLNALVEVGSLIHISTV